MARCFQDSTFANCPEDLPGFKGFMTKFLIQMSRDFATRSMEISDQSQGEGFCKPEINDRQRWGYSKNYDENYLIHDDFTEIFFILGGKTLRIPMCFSTMTDTPWHFLDFLLIATWKFSVRKRAKYFIKTSSVSLCIKHWVTMALSST